ncbi:sensor histidine kinase [Roseivivax sp. CAU 1761]
MLLNLVSNAMKHHDGATGRIAVRATRRDGGTRIEVSDDGPGIPLAHQGRIFELFQTLRSRDVVEGSGLGLALVDKLVRELGGTISVHSDPEQRRGTTFRLDLPAPRAAPAPGPDALRSIAA